jgi:hypothetical protein
MRYLVIGVTLLVCWITFWLTWTLGLHHKPDQLEAVVINFPIIYACVWITGIPVRRERRRLRDEIERIGRDREQALRELMIRIRR